MTKLTFFINGEHYLGFQCKGHSGYAKAGEDIVCAAISAAVQLTAEYLTSYYENDVELFIDENSAEITLRCRVYFLEADRQLNVLRSFSESISKQYPDYFDIEFTEV